MPGQHTKPMISALLGLGLGISANIYLFAFFFIEVLLIYLQSYVNFCCTEVIQLYILFHIIFHYGLSQHIEYSSLCFIVGPVFIHSVYNSLYLLTPNSQSIPPSPSFLIFF